MYTNQQQIIAEEFERSGLGKLQIELTEDDTLGNHLKVRTITSVHAYEPKARLSTSIVKFTELAILAGLYFRLVAFRIPRCSLLSGRPARRPQRAILLK